MAHRPVKIACLLAWVAANAACSDVAPVAPGEDASHDAGQAAEGAPADRSVDTNAEESSAADVSNADQNSAAPDANARSDAAPSADADADATVDAAAPVDSAPSDGGASSDASTAGDASRPGWRLVWRDEFDGPSGSPPDGTKWVPQIGRNNSNGELEYYTARPDNLALDGNGNLAITARRESYMGAAYTSARLSTGGKFEQAYGRFEARLKLPGGQGLWPAFWTLGNDIGRVGWPACGEIDIMENVGRDPETSLGALHGPGYSGSNPLSGAFRLPGGYTTAFHVFALEWEPNVTRFYVDDNLFETRTPADLAARGGNFRWVYDHPFTVILNVAVGGGYPGNPNASTPFPQALLADYVRVYAR